MVRIHLSKLEDNLALGAIVVFLALVGVWVYSIFCPLPQWLQGFNTTALIALGAAYIALGTHLANRHHRRRSLRRSVGRELTLSVKQVALFAHNLYSEDEIEIDYSTFPDDILAAQLADMGQLSDSEIEHLSNYYSLAQIFKSQLSEIREEGTTNTRDVHESLSGTSTDKPIAVELLVRANKALGSLEYERSFELDVDHFPSEDWNGEPIEVEYEDILQPKGDNDDENRAT